MPLRRKRPERPLVPGASVGFYRLERLIGRGGMGTVYLAVDPRLNRTVALKVLSADVGRDPVFQERFRREAIAQAALEHPNIVPVYETGEDRGRPFLAMRYIDGQTLKELLAAGTPEPAAAVALLAQIADALETAHEAGIVHRDIKPQNILIEGGTAYLADFGLTKMRGARDLTHTGHQLGTIDYMSPEQFRNEPATARSDVYSLAAVLYECLAGHVPFQRESDFAVMYAHLEDPLPSLAAAVSSLPERLDAIVGAAMSKDPADRPDSPNAFLGDVAGALGVRIDGTRRPARGVSPTAPMLTTSRAPSGQQWRLRLAVAVVVAAGGVGAGVAASAVHEGGRRVPEARAAVSRRVAVGPAAFDVPVGWKVRRSSANAATFALNAKDTLSVRTSPNARSDVATLHSARRSGVTVSGRYGDLYEGQAAHGGTVALYVIPLATRDLVATCRTTRRERKTCAAIVGTAQIHAAGLRTLPRTAYVARVNEVLRSLAQTRLHLRTSLRRASTSSAQAAASDALKAEFAAAATAVGRIRERDVPADAGARLMISLRAVTNAYGALARAIRAGSPSMYAAAATSVADSERKARRAAAQLRP